MAQQNPLNKPMLIKGEIKDKVMKLVGHLTSKGVVVWKGPLGIAVPDNDVKVLADLASDAMDDADPQINNAFCDAFDAAVDVAFEKLTLKGANRPPEKILQIVLTVYGDRLASKKGADMMYDVVSNAVRNFSHDNETHYMTKHFKSLISQIDDIRLSFVPKNYEPILDATHSLEEASSSNDVEITDLVGDTSDYVKTTDLPDTSF